jgi:hypothetical protein
MQITLHERSDGVLTDEQRGVHHLGVTLGIDELDRIAARVNKHHVRWLDPLCTEYAGSPTSNGKGRFWIRVATPSRSRRTQIGRPPSRRRAARPAVPSLPDEQDPAKLGFNRRKR